MDTKNINWIPQKKININLVNELLEKCLETNQFTNYGPNVKLLEEIIMREFEIENDKEVIVVSNASIAIQCLASSIEKYENTKINWATQSFTFPPSAQGTLNESKILDIDLDGGIDLTEIDDSINGLIVTNIFGNIVDIDKYVNYCNLNNKFLIFDNAATPYTFYKNRNCLNYGVGSIISFHHTKPIGFGEGGAIIVDKKYSEIARKLTNFGIQLDKDNYFSRLGNNYKMSEISAVYIIQYIKDNFQYLKNKHIELYSYIKNKIQEIPNCNFYLFPSFHSDYKILSSCFTLLFKDYNDNVRLKLLENNIFCRKYYEPLKNTNNAIDIYSRILCITCNKDMDIKDIDKIITIIQSCY
jgi:dTDP-4-amino-4,6-dideoxygalactose transaminase